MPKRLFVETVGCQMNVLDSELLVGAFRAQGYELAEHAADADVILFNTCSVRKRAEDKVYSNLGRLRQLKLDHPEKVIGVIGCMAQNHQTQIFRRVSFVDLVVGPGQLHQIPELVEKVQRGAEQQIEVSLGRTEANRASVMRSHESFDPLRDPQMRPTSFQAYVRTQIGCDNFCTYCIVPSVRGPEQHRPIDAIVAESRKLVDHGCVEITLLGQTVNSYHYTDENNRSFRLADVLASLQEIEGLRRIKFVTNHPKDMTDSLLEAMRDLPKVSPYLHVPAQSGSNQILERMKRRYTVEHYREMMRRIRDTVPGATISSDFIVGFCGETEKDFLATVDLVRDCRFKNSFIFKYSTRPGTRAADLYDDDVPDEEKRRRNQELLMLQNQISAEENQKEIGKMVKVLVEGPSKSSRTESNHPNNNKTESPTIQLTGRTHADRIVVFNGSPNQIGQIIEVTIHDATPHTLLGEVH